jgi:SHS2 domain-containing protein
VRDGYRLIDHTADFGLEIYGSNPTALFTQAAGALFDLITDTSALRGDRCHQIDISGDDWPDLLVNWLRELLYLWNGMRQLLCDVTIDRIDETQIRATVTCADYVPQQHEIRNEIKAVTYHQAAAVPSEKGWLARVYLDV